MKKREQTEYEPMTEQKEVEQTPPIYLDEWVTHPATPEVEAETKVEETQELPPEPPKEAPTSRSRKTKAADWHAAVADMIERLADEDASDATVITVASELTDLLEDESLPKSARAWLQKAETQAVQGVPDALRRVRNSLQVAAAADSIPD